MRLFDTRTRALADLVAARTVRLYVCGITPYESAHLGHAFTYTSFDALARYLEHLGHRVRYARNITDVDDDILRVARERGQPVDKLARAEVEQFDREMAALNLRAPDVVPWASETVPAMVPAIEGLLRLQCAYALPDGRVYFDVTAAGDYGGLSRLDHAEMLRQFGQKGGDPEAPGKRAALDFLLWQPSEPDEPSWPAPWGAGRPGWHIECSVMAMEHLGSVIDIHGGGDDLVFPHHEAEIAQSEHLTGQSPFARFWMHCGMVGLDGVKMSKSLGNLVYVPDLVERHDGAAVRRYLLAHHYRQTWSHSDDELAAAAAGVARWRAAAAGTLPASAASINGVDQGLESAFHAALAADLDTPTALSVIDDAAEAGAGSTLRKLAGILGFFLPE